MKNWVGGNNIDRINNIIVVIMLTRSVNGLRRGRGEAKGAGREGENVYSGLLLSGQAALQGTRARDDGPARSGGCCH